MSKRKKSPGAGRPQELKDPVQRLVILESHQNDWLALQGAESRLGASGFLRKVIEDLISQQASAGSVARSISQQASAGSVARSE